MDLIIIDSIHYAKATDLFIELGIKRKYSNWIKESIQRAGLSSLSDFVTILSQSTGGRPVTEYLLTRDSAISITMMSGGKFASNVRKKLIELYNQHDTGLAFTASQIEALMDLSKAMTLVSIQEKVEKNHFAIYNDKYTWYQYRAALLGYNTQDIIDAMRKVNKKHHSARTSLMKLDANELIRIGVIDLMICLGKSQEYATNIGNLCKSMSEKMKLGNIIWDDTVDNPLKLNQGEINDRKGLFNNSINKL